jgi:phenylalanyl-tRNA synthetase beta chain
LHTESSHRFERGVDYNLQVRAIQRATRLILDIVGGQPGPVTAVNGETLPKPTAIFLRRATIAKLLGLELADAQVEKILQGLGIVIEPAAGGWKAIPPSWRFDLAIEVDLIEELARIYGYNRLPVRSIRSDLPLAPRPESRLSNAVLRRSLVARGYQEAITYSFVDPKLQALLAPGQAVVELRNPIASDMAAMRTTLWAGLLNTLIHNLNRQQQRIRLFELGLRFVPQPYGLQQEPMLALAVTGRRYPESWSGGADSADFYDIKGDAEAIFALARIGGEIDFAVGNHPALHPGQCAEIRRNGKSIGHIGALHPELQRQLDIGQPVYLMEIQLAALAEGSLPAFGELSRFPEVRRDLAVLVPRDLPAEKVLAAVREVAGESLRDLRLFDVYQGKGIDPQRKSLALGLTFQHSSRTLTEDEINTAVTAVVNLLTSRFEAILRN